MSSIVPSMSWLADGAFLSYSIPVFRSIAFNTISTSSVVTFRAARLLLILTKSVVWKDFGKGSAKEKGN